MESSQPFGFLLGPWQALPGGISNDFTGLHKFDANGLDCPMSGFCNFVYAHTILELRTYLFFFFLGPGLIKPGCPFFDFVEPFFRQIVIGSHIFGFFLQRNSKDFILYWQKGKIAKGMYNVEREGILGAIMHFFDAKWDNLKKRLIG